MKRVLLRDPTPEEFWGDWGDHFSMWNKGKGDNINK